MKKKTVNTAADYIKEIAKTLDKIEGNIANNKSLSKKEFFSIVRQTLLSTRTFNRRLYGNEELAFMIFDTLKSAGYKIIRKSKKSKIDSSK